MIASMVIALVPLKCSSRSLRFPHRLSFTEEKCLGALALSKTKHTGSYFFVLLFFEGEGSMNGPYYFILTLLLLSGMGRDSECTLTPVQVINTACDKHGCAQRLAPYTTPVAHVCSNNAFHNFTFFLNARPLQKRTN